MAVVVTCVRCDAVFSVGIYRRSSEKC